MNSELHIFNFNASESIRTVSIRNEVWFVGKDIADALGYDQTSNMVKRLDEEDFMSSKLEGMNMNSILINESGLYSAIIGSQLPDAKKFKRWVTQEVLPSIRKHGMYANEETIEQLLNNPDTMIKTLEALKSERAARVKAEAIIESQKPQMLFAKAVEASKTSILVGELAKILKQSGIEMGQNRLFEWLREQGYLSKRVGTDWNMPTQKSMDLKLFEIKESVHLNSSGANVTTKTTKVTGKGQIYFINQFLATE